MMDNGKAYFARVREAVDDTPRTTAEIAKIAGVSTSAAGMGLRWAEKRALVSVKFLKRPTGNWNDLYPVYQRGA